MFNITLSFLTEQNRTHVLHIETDVVNHTTVRLAHAAIYEWFRIPRYPQGGD